MRREVNQRLTHWLLYDFIRGQLLAFVLSLLFLAALVFWATNEPVSSQIFEGRFVRRTVHQADIGQSLPRVFVDLPDGRTIAAVAWTDWRPPAIGASIRLQEDTLRWYGRNYRIVP